MMMDISPHYYYSHSPPLLFFAAAFIVLLFLCDSAADDVNYVKCSKRFECGGHPPVGFPFWGGDRPEQCGLPGLELECDSESSTVTTTAPGIKFRVLALDMSQRTIRITPEEFFNGSCLTQFDISDLNVSSIFQYAADDENSNLTLYYDCTPPLTLPSVFDGLSCINVNNENLTLSIHGTAEICDHNSTIPILPSLGKELEGGEKSVGEVLKQGFELIWDGVLGDDCRSCVEFGGQCGYTLAGTEFACFCRDQSYPDTCSRGSRRNWVFKAIIASGAGVGFLFATFMVICLHRRCRSFNRTIFFWKKRSIDQQKIQAFIRDHGFIASKRYSYAQVRTMTNSFHNKLGQGGYGSVFKGKLPNGKPVAVKVLSTSKGDGEDFINEVASISKTSHVNIVTLVGFCFEGPKRALIYEFLVNGSLEKFIYINNSSKASQHLGWEKLYQIAIGIARGLEYLHQGCSTQILHFDIKPHNILLDEDFHPKISDFGLSKLSSRKQSMISMMDARGTIGYIAPEVFNRNFGGVSYKSDVYSYGMMVLEMVGGRNNLNAKADKTSEIYFPHWIYRRVELDEDLGLQGNATEEENEIARKMILVGLWCIQTDPSLRPCMNEVLEMLGGSLRTLQIPPKPFISTTGSSTAPTSLP